MNCIGLPWKISPILMLPALKNRETRRPALFISGGISALLMDYMTQTIRNGEAEQTLVKEILMPSIAEA